MISPPRHLSLFSLVFLMAVLALCNSDAARADEPFYLYVAGSSQVISCEKVRLDPGSFRCKKGRHDLPLQGRGHRVGDLQG